MRRRRVAAALSGASLLLTATACTAPAATSARHRTGAGRSTTTTAPAPTTTRPSATPTTVNAPVVLAPGWSQPLTTLPPGGGFTSVSCISDVFCVAVGGGANSADAEGTAGAGVTLSWDGAAWSSPSVYFPAPASGAVTAPYLPAISCTHGPFCAIVDGSDHTSSGDGTNWSSPNALAPAPAALANPADPGPGHPGSRTAAVDCPDARFCALVDNTGHVSTLQAGVWSVPQTFSSPTMTATGPAVALYQTGRVGLTCNGDSDCVAVIGAAVLDWDGSGWAKEPSPWVSPATVGSGDSAVACPTVSLCAIVHGTSVSVRTSGPGWAPPQVIDPAGGLDALSCPTATFCMAADASGNVLQWNGGPWSTPLKIVPSPTGYTGDGTTLSCPSAHFCMLLTGDGDYATYQGPGSATAPATSAPSTP